MLKRIATMLWGKFEDAEELKKFGYLAVIFGFIIGTYWSLRPLKDGLFSAIVGIDYQPHAKMLSLFVVAPLVIVYSKLIDMFPRQKLFYVLVGFYALLALVFAYFMFHPTIGLPNTAVSGARMLGWCWYVYVESFGSLVVALFWAFTTDTTMPESAKRGFPIIALFGQIGNMVGPFFMRANYWGLATSAPLVGACGGLMVITILLFWLMMRTVSESQFASYHGGNEGEVKATEEPGFLDGLKLLFTHRYLLSMFIIISSYEVIVTILDFHFKKTAKLAFPLEADFSSYLASYGYMTGLVSMLCVLLGINNIQRKLGMTASLILLPFIVGLGVVAIKFNPTGVTLAFIIMVGLKAINYALNQPTMKQLYIPTTKDTRYKAQAWIEMFGSRGSKAGGSFVNNMRKTFVGNYGPTAGLGAFMWMTVAFSGSLIAVWLVAALYVAKSFDTAIKEDRVVC